MIRILLFLLLLQGPLLAQNSFRQLNPLDFEQALRENREAVLIDLRNVESYMKGHIRKAVVIDFLRDDFREYFLGRYPLKTTPLFLYGQSADNSEHTGLYIAELGYENITVLKGGFENWIRKSRPYRSVSTEFKPLGYVSKENYSHMVREKKWVLVVFHEDYCAPCENLGLAGLQAENPDLYIARINSETNGEIAEWLNIRRNPTVILYKDGIQYWRSTEEITRQKIRENIY